MCSSATTLIARYFRPAPNRRRGPPRGRRRPPRPAPRAASPGSARSPSTNRTGTPSSALRSELRPDHRLHVVAGLRGPPRKVAPDQAGRAGDQNRGAASSMEHVESLVRLEASPMQLALQSTQDPTARAAAYDTRPACRGTELVRVSRSTKSRSPTRHGCLYSSKLPRWRGLLAPHARSRCRPALRGPATGSNRPLAHFSAYSSLSCSRLAWTRAGQLGRAAADALRLDQQHVARLLFHHRREREGLDRQPQSSKALFDGANHLVLAELLAREAREVLALVRNSSSGAWPSKPTQRTTSWMS